MGNTVVGNQEKVFVVDDDEAVRNSLKALLEATGYTVETFESGLRFLETDDISRVGCVIMDVRMPEIDGIETQRRLAAERDQLPIVIVTGYANVPMAVKAIKSGAFDFLEKPFSHEAIIDVVERALDNIKKIKHSESSRRDVVEKIEQLTVRERQIFGHIVVGKQNKVIANELGISPRTVEVHRSRVMEKMEARGLSHLVRMALVADVDLDETEAAGDDKAPGATPVVRKRERLAG